MKKVVKIILIVILSIVFVTSISVIDYSISRIWGTRPILALKKENTLGQFNEYTGIFYKAWICTQDKSIYKVDYKDKVPLECPKLINFDKDGNYTTYNNLKVSILDYETVKNYYSYMQINSWEEEELKDALYIGEKLEKSKFTTREGYYVEYNHENYSIAIFQDIFTSSWRYKYNDENYHYCIKTGEDKYLFSKYENNTCKGDFKPLEFDEKWCGLFIKTKANEVAKAYYDVYCK